MSNNQTQLIIQAIESAEKNLVLAKKLLGGEGIAGPGLIGEFDGEFIVTKEGRRHQVPPNYASKSRLVAGDTLRMIGLGEKAIFKQIKKVERLKTSGVLSKKDGQWTAVTEAGSFFVLPVSVKHFNGEIGDEVEVIIPKDYKRVKPKWAALEQVATTEARKEVETRKKPATTEARKEMETQKEVLPKRSKVPMKPETPKIPKTPKVTKKTVTTETRKEAEALKEPMKPKKPKVKEEPPGAVPAAVKGEIKVEEELR